VEVVKSFGNFVITVNGSDHCLSNIEYKEVTYSTIFYFTTTSSEYRKKESPEKAIPLSFIIMSSSDYQVRLRKVMKNPLLKRRQFVSINAVITILLDQSCM
jgi:hypothetical protein